MSKPHNITKLNVFEQLKDQLLQRGIADRTRNIKKATELHEQSHPIELKNISL